MTQIFLAFFHPSFHSHISEPTFICFCMCSAILVILQNGPSCLLRNLFSFLLDLHLLIKYVICYPTSTYANQDIHKIYTNYFIFTAFKFIFIPPVQRENSLRDSCVEIMWACSERYPMAQLGLDNFSMLMCYGERKSFFRLFLYVMKRQNKIYFRNKYYWKLFVEQAEISLLV